MLHRNIEGKLVPQMLEGSCTIGLSSQDVYLFEF